MTDILMRIAAAKRLEVEARRIELPLERLQRRLNESPLPEAHRFASVLSSSEQINIIAEIKKGSPSQGIMVEDFDAGSLAKSYRAGGAAALSVLTDHDFFYGSFENLVVARKQSGLPVLCKDFILDPYQLYHARYHSADAALLIVRLHSARSLQQLIQTGTELGMDLLVETRSEDEVSMAIDSGAQIVGVNNRDLSDFSIDLAISERLARSIPDSVTKVTESGIFEPAHIVRLRNAGYHCFLIGQALVQAKDPVALIESLRSA